MLAHCRLLVAVLLAAGCASAERPHLGRQETLPPLARSIVKKEMSRHGKDVEALLDAVIVLDHARAAELAGELAAEPRIARPGGDQSTANALFPERFFELQDALHDEAGRMSEAARAGDDEALGTSFTKLTATCVACHATYLHLPAGAP